MGGSCETWFFNVDGLSNWEQHVVEFIVGKKLKSLGSNKKKVYCHESVFGWEGIVKKIYGAYGSVWKKAKGALNNIICSFSLSFWKCEKKKSYN